MKLIHIGPAPHYKEYLEKEAKDETRIEVFCESHPFNEVLWLQDKAAINIIIEAKAEFSPFFTRKISTLYSSRKTYTITGTS